MNFRHLPADELDRLVAEACARALSETELETLCRLAQQAGRSETIVVQLLSAGTVAGRINLRGARALTAPHASRPPTPKSIRRDKAAEKATRIKAARATGLPFSITEHAFERFVERHCPHELPDLAMAHLVAEAASATPLRDRTITGQEQWIGPSGVLFVMKRDGAHAPPVCVTVLPPNCSERRGA